MDLKKGLNIMSRLVSFTYNVTEKKNNQKNNNKKKPNTTAKPNHKTYSVWGTTKSSF